MSWLGKNRLIYAIFGVNSLLPILIHNSFLLCGKQTFVCHNNKKLSTATGWKTERNTRKILTFFAAASAYACFLLYVSMKKKPTHILMPFAIYFLSMCVCAWCGCQVPENNFFSFSSFFFVGENEEKKVWKFIAAGWF